MTQDTARDEDFDDTEGEIRSSPRKPWEQFYPDRPGELKCDEHSNARMHVFTALVLFGFGYYVYTQTSLENSSDDLFLYALRGIFPAIGVFLLLLAFRASARMKKFGISTLTIKDNAGVLGKTLSGTLRTSVELRPTGPYHVTLECLETYKTGNDAESKTRQRSVWKGSTSIAAQTASSIAGIPISVEIPIHLPHSKPNAGLGGIRWVLTVSAPMPGVDYKSSFNVPVYKADRI